MCKGQIVARKQSLKSLKLKLSKWTDKTALMNWLEHLRIALSVWFVEMIMPVPMQFILNLLLVELNLKMVNISGYLFRILFAKNSGAFKVSL